MSLINKKEELGWVFLSIGVMLFFSILLFKFDASITGYATFSGDTVTTETVHVVVGDEVIYTGVCAEVSCDDSDCDGSISGGTLTIPATAENSNCQCIVSTLASGCILTETVTLVIHPSTCTASTNNSLTTLNDDTTIMAFNPDDAGGLSPNTCPT